ncbi:MAG: D-alanyl-D-alanine carboxypeptidase/D-alanyl-D-alanine-endopeptidase [Planctomycetota bacterium]
MIVEALTVAVSFLGIQDPAAALSALLAEPALDGARIGVIVRDLRDDRVVAEHDSNYGFMTASNMKLVSIAVALESLGADFRFATTLVTAAQIHDGVLDGDLVLVGSGDPTFGGRQEKGDGLAVFDRMIAELKSTHGLRRINGHVVGDDDVQPDEVMGEGWAWNYQGDSYAAQVGGLCFAENCATLAIEPGEVGSPASVRVLPTTSLLTLQGRVETAEREQQRTAWATRERGRNVVRLGGAIPAGARPFRTSVSVENPTLHAATALRDRLIASGIEVGGAAIDRDDLPTITERYGDDRVLAVHESEPLDEILVTLGKVSQNLYAEQVLRAAAGGNRGMTAAAGHAKRVLEEFGVDTKGMRIADGSGLSRLDLVKPAQLEDLVRAMWRSPGREDFLRTLPVGGVDGTLASRFRDPALRGRVVAKTGNISGVTALSGYILSANPEEPPLTFSILINNFTCPTSAAKEAMDRFLAVMVGWRR